MRIQPWMTIVASFFMLAAVQTETFGQQPLPPGGYPPGTVNMPYQGSSGPVVHHPPYATNHPQAMYPQGTPPGFNPWPQISPYNSPNVAMDQHYNQNGTWFRDILYRSRTYTGSIELMSVAFRDAGNTRIGSPYATYTDFTDGGTQVPEGVPITQPFGTLPSVPNFAPPVLGFFSVDTRILGIPALDGGNLFNGQANGYLYPVRNTNETRNLGRQLGTQIRWGFENEDGTGLQLNGWWAFDDSARFKQGADSINGVPVNQTLTLFLGAQNLFINGVVPYFTGEPIAPDFGPGRTAKYDILFEFEHSTRAAGSNISFYTQPIYKSKGIRIRRLWGARYHYLDENFRFRGIDSGLTYDLDAAAAGGGGGANASTFRPTGTISIVHDQYEATLNSEVRSHMAGPEFGFRFDLGDRNAPFRMWGETIFGILANQENISISGDNIGDPLFEGRFENIGNPRMLDPTVQSEFSDKKSTTHVSPSFQQSIFAEIDAFRNLPIIRNAAMFEDTSFRVGYTFFWVGEVARPAEAIKWQGFPLFPEAQSNRTSWWMHQLNFAVDWTF